MDIQLKQRLVGAVVLISLAVIFIPSILDERIPMDSGVPVTKIEIKPALKSEPEREPDKKLSSQIIPLEGTKNRAIIPIGKSPVPSAKPADMQMKAKVVVKPKVIVEKELPPKTGMVSWTVQVAVLSSEKGAVALVNKLKKKGFSAFYEKTYRSDGSRYRVRVKPVYDQKEAKKLKQEIDKVTGLKGLIVRYP